MGRGLIIVRHAMSAVVADVPSREWSLSESAREDCVILSDALPRRLGPVVFTSAEPKAQETGAIIALRKGLTTEEHPGFGEVERPWEPGDNDAYRATAARYINGETIPGWEPVEQVRSRFRAAVEHALGTPGDDDIVIATHGMSPSIYLSTQLDFDTVEFWRALTFPDAWRLDTDTGELTHLFHGGLNPD